MVIRILLGGELGIRTLGGLTHTAFRVLHLRPLGQLSIYVFAVIFSCFFKPFRTPKNIQIGFGKN